MPFASSHTPVAALAFAAIAALIVPDAAHAQSYPTRPVRMIVPYGPAGTVDIFARAVGQKLGESLGQQFVIDNIPGANGIVGAEVAARAAKDGHTIMMVAVNHTINPALYRKMAFDPVRDFSGISTVGSVVQVLSVHPSLPVRSAGELVALAKARPGQLNFSSTGSGSPTHLYGELIKRVAGVDMVHVPYKAAGPALTALVSGEVAASFLVMTSALPHGKAGRVRPLAVVGVQRSPLAPELPTLGEAGLKGFERESWVALIAPAGVPRDVIARLNGEVRKALESRDVRERLQAQGVHLGANSPEELDALMRSDAERWGELIRALDLKLE